MVNYTKNRWNNYDDSKTFSENLENDAILTLEKANHMEQGIYDANRRIEIGTIKVAENTENPSITVTYNQDYEFDVVLSGSFSVYIDRWRKEDEWAMHEERIDMNFDVKGKERRYGYDQEGKPIVYSTSGGSKSFPFSGLRQSCQIDCATTSPEKINLRAELNGELAFHIESTYMGDTHIILAQKSINCNIYKMR